MHTWLPSTARIAQPEAAGHRLVTDWSLVVSVLRGYTQLVSDNPTRSAVDVTAALEVRM